MKYLPLRGSAACVCLFLPIVALGQSTPPSPETTPPAQTPPAKTPPVATQPEELVVLSPFVVDSSSDEGYSSAFSTSGSRLKTDLKDLAASVTPLTNDFLDDLGANDIASALAFVSGAENDSTYHQEGQTFSGANNYIGGDFGDNNNRSGEVRVRGLGRATTTINYIEVQGSTDRYNLDRSELLRGANSILFGLAEPAGLINSSTKTARTNRNTTKIETKFDNLGSNRFVLDHNQVLVKNRLALRAVGLYNDQQYKIKSAFARDKRLFATVTFTPFSGTSLKAYYEAQNAYGRRPNFRTVQDNVSDWLRAYNTYAPRLTPAQIAQIFYWDPSLRTGNAPATPASFTLTDGTVVDGNAIGLIRRNLDSTDRGTAIIYSGNGQWTDPLDNRVTLLSTRLNTGTGGDATPNGRFARSGGRTENTLGFLDAQVIDRGIFPYDTVEIAALPGAFRAENDHKAYVNFEQRITPNFYVSGTFQQETRTAEQYFPTITQTNQISVDVNTTLPNGNANPNFLRPFIYGRNLGEYINSRSENSVLQANYDFDFAKKTNSLGWLGFHRFTTVYNKTQLNRLRYQYNYQFDSDIPGILPRDTLTNPTPPAQPQITGIASDNVARFNMQLWYVGDPVQVGDTALRFTGFPSTLDAQQNRSYDYQYFNGTSGTWQISPTKINVGRHVINNGRTFTINQNNGTGLSLQSFFWKRKVVTLFGWRKDYVDNIQRSLITTGTVTPFPTRLGKTRDDYLNTGARFLYEAETSTQSIVYKINDWLRVFANASENFAATSQRQDNLYRQVAPQNGETRELGLAFNLFHDKLNVRFTHFSSTQALAGSNVFGQVPNNRISAFEGRLYNAISGLGRLSEWEAYGEFSQLTNSQYVTPNGNTTTESRESTGTSMELSFAPTQNWDIVFNVDQVDNKITVIGTELADYFTARENFYRKWFNEGIITMANNGTTAVQDFVANVAAEYIAGSAFLGTSNRGVSDYNATLVGRYKFLEGTLKGFTVGANLRWESGKAIGYRLKPALVNFGGLTNYPGQVYDVDNPFMGDPELTGGMQINYKRKILSGRVNWKIQLNAQNLFTKTGLRVIGANSDGSPTWAVVPDRTYELSNSFEF